jgi:hypothetical protein
MSGENTYIISSQIYYDTFNTCYKRIVTIDRMPIGILATITRRLTNTKLSDFKQSTSCCPIERCIFAIYNPTDNTSELLTVERQGILISYLITNGYTINTTLTELTLNNGIKSEKQIMYVISK